MKNLIIFASIVVFVTAQVRINPCENLPDGNGFVNDYSSCPAYYTCVRFLAFIQTCPEPFHFKETAPGEGLCQWPEEANCQPCPAVGLLMVHVPESCTEFTLCMDGVAFPRECPPGQLFDRQFGLCIREDMVDCPYY